MSQTIPSFDGVQWSSTDGCGGGYNAFKVLVAGVQAMIQEIHFDGRDGSYRISHGYGNRAWIGDGYLFRANQSDLISFIAAFETYINDDYTGTWRTLIDSMGNTWTNMARITSVTTVDSFAYAGGWAARLTITGVFNGSPVMSGT